METPTYILPKIVKAPDDLVDFVGPLDVILHLLSKDKIEIKDIQISVILEQYVAYLEKMKTMDLEIASEFVAMASHLLYIKTKKLLLLDKEEADAEMEQLIKTLEEHRRREDYKKIRYACETLGARVEIGRNIITRPPTPLISDKAYAHIHTKEDLLVPIRDMILRSERRLPPPVTAFDGIVGRETYSVSEKVSEVLTRLRSGMMKFVSLLASATSRSEIVATFLAVLELCKDKAVKLDGPDYDYILKVNDTEWE